MQLCCSAPLLSRRTVSSCYGDPVVQTRNGPATARRSERARQAILAAALDLVCEVGYTNLRVEGIAARAGVGKQTIYRWWPSKGAVLLDAFLWLDDPHQAGPPALPDTGDLEADLTAALRQTVAELTDPRRDPPLRALTTAIAHDPELAESYAARVERPAREARRDRLRSAQRAGQLAPDADLDVAADMVWGAALTRWIERSGPLTPDFADQVVQTALSGLRPRPR
jgi:AcrR family transcriptional regulator